MGRRKLPDGDKLRDLYVDQKMSLGDIAERYGASRGAVAQALTKAGVERRSKSQARIIALKKGKLPHSYHDFDRGFFKRWTPESAYLLGLIYADGYVGEGVVRFAFGRGSKELLWKIKGLLRSDHEPDEYDNNGYPAWRLIFSSIEMVEDIGRMGLSPGPKSTTKAFPDLPEGMERHFVRGYLDGNGSISPEYGILRFHTGSGDFAVGLRNCIWDCFVRDFGDSPSGGTIHDESGKVSVFPDGKRIEVKSAFTIVYASKQDTANLLEWLYDGVPETCYLKRKKDALEQLVEWKNWGK